MSPTTESAFESQTMSPDEIRGQVVEGYSAVAEGEGKLAIVDSQAQALAFGYDEAALALAPNAANLGLGCGNPTGRATIRPGDVVLDLGCGAGIDVFIAAQKVGETGKAIGVDMTSALLSQARQTAKSEGIENVEFKLGTMEALPLDDNSVDIIVSNCAINLSPEKPLVFAEAARVLKPGGRIVLSDLVVERELPAEVKASVDAYIGCVGGAITQAEYSDLVVEAGFSNVDVVVALDLSQIISPDDPRVLEVLSYAGGTYSDQEISDVLSTIKSLSVSATLTESAQNDPTSASSLASDSDYIDLLSYVVSNAVAGEIMAVENYSDMVALFDDIDGKLDAVEQARDEGRHIRQLTSLGDRLGFDVMQRIIEPEWKAIRAAFKEAVANQDLAACLIIQDVMTESMAIVLYETLSGLDETETDELTASVAATILADEREHLQIGATRLAQMRSEDPDRVDRALRWAQPLVMPQLFGMVDTSCESLCGDLLLDCNALDLGAAKADLDMIRAKAAIQYGEALAMAGFPSSVTGPLMSRLAALDADEASSRVVRGPVDSCC